MSDNNDLDDDISGVEDAEGGFDDFAKQGTLGDMWRNNPMVKIGAVLGVFAAIVAGIMLFGGKEVKTPPSMMRGGSEVKEAPGMSEVSPAYKEQIDIFNKTNVETAMKEGKSALPVPVEPPVGRISPPEEEEVVEDPLERWRKLQEEKAKQAVVKQEPVAGGQKPQRDPRAEAVNALAKLMSKQMETVLNSKVPPEPKLESITAPEWLQGLREAEASRMKEAAQAQGQNGEHPDSGTRGGNDTVILLPAATVEYGQMLTEANSDVPGPVLGQIVTGPLAGSRVLGSFEVVDDYLVISFDTAVIEGVSYDIDAVAMNPNTTLPAMATEIDRRYLKKIALPMAGAFVEGLASAISESGTTTITINNGGTATSQEQSDKNSRQEVASGIAEAGQELRDILDEEKDKTKTLVRVAAGTPMGILFLEPVEEGKSKGAVVKEDESGRSALTDALTNIANTKGENK